MYIKSKLNFASCILLLFLSQFKSEVYQNPQYNICQYDLHAHTDPHKRYPHPIMARAGSLPAECCFSIFILHLLRDRQGGSLTPPATLWRMMGSRRSVPLLLHSSCITLSQQCPILHNRKKPFDWMGLCSHAWCFRQGSMKSDPSQRLSHPTNSPLWVALFKHAKWASSCQMACHTNVCMCLYFHIINSGSVQHLLV